MDNSGKLGNIGTMPMSGKLRTIGKTGKIGKIVKIGKIEPTEAGNQRMVPEQAITVIIRNMLWLVRHTVNSQQIRTPPVRDFLEEKL